MVDILLIGSRGRLGKDICSFFDTKYFNILATTSEDLDITVYDDIKRFLENKKIDYIINCAAYTNVDLAEKEKEKAYLVNEIGPLNLAKLAFNKDIPLIHISTDYVFDGNTTVPYNVDSKTNPINVYGKSKLAGELAVINNCNKFYIIRTSWVYGLTGNNFINIMLESSKSQSFIKVVNDQYGCPSFTYDILNAIAQLILQKSNYGLYHFCGKGYTTWYDFAKKIFELADIKIDVIPIESKELQRLAKRPYFTAMNNYNSCRGWEEALDEYLKMKGIKK